MPGRPDDDRRSRTSSMTNATGEKRKTLATISTKRIEQQIRGYVDINFRKARVREFHTALKKHIGEPESIYDPYSAYNHIFHDISIN